MRGLVIRKMFAKKTKNYDAIPKHATGVPPVPGHGRDGHVTSLQVGTTPALSATPPDSGGESLRNSPPQMRRGGALSAGVVLNRGERDAGLIMAVPTSFSVEPEKPGATFGQMVTIT
jgi:hypothetical protein